MYPEDLNPPPPTNPTPPENPNPNPPPPEPNPPKGTTEPPPEKTDDKTPSAVDPEALTFDKLTVPEGIDVTNPLGEKFLGILNNKDLTPADRANQLLGLQTELAKQIEEHNAQSWLDLNSQWQSALIKEHGEDKLEAHLSKMGGLIKAYGADRTGQFKAGSATGVDVPNYEKDLRDALTMTGAGNNPHIVNFMIWAANQLGEGSPLGGTPPGGQQSRAERMFGS